MPWTESRLLSSFVTDALNQTSGIDLNGDTIEAALFDNTITPDQAATSARAAFNGSGGAWATGHVTDTGTSAPTGWPTLGRPLQSITSAFTGNVYTFSAVATTSANAVTTITDAYGCLLYDHAVTTPVADPGICYAYFGGANSISLGSFVIAWNPGGIFTITL